MSDLRFGRLIPAMITPFDDALEVDFDRAQQLVDRLIKGGCDSVLICGTTGESPTISIADKLKLFKACVEASDGRAPVIANVGNNCTSDSIAFAREAEKTGVDGLMLVVPYYNKPPQEGLYQHFSTVAASVDKPIVLYNIPGRCVVNMTAETTLRLANDCDNIVAIKEASGKMDQIADITAGAPDGFDVYSGDDSATLAIMELGGIGVISTIANVAPERMAEIVNAYATGNVDVARKRNKDLLPLMTGLFKTSNPILVKEGLKLVGFDCGGVRLPLVNATDEQSSELAATMHEVGVL